MKTVLRYILFGVVLLTACYGDPPAYSGTLKIENNTAFTLTFPDGINVWDDQNQSWVCSIPGKTGKTVNAIPPYSSGSVYYESSGYAGTTANCRYGNDANYYFWLQAVYEGSAKGDKFEGEINRKDSKKENWADPFRAADVEAGYDETLRITWLKDKQSARSVTFGQEVMKLRGTKENPIIQKIRKSGKLL